MIRDIRYLALNMLRHFLLSLYHIKLHISSALKHQSTKNCFYKKFSKSSLKLIAYNFLYSNKSTFSCCSDIFLLLYWKKNLFRFCWVWIKPHKTYFLHVQSSLSFWVIETIVLCSKDFVCHCYWIRKIYIRGIAMVHLAINLNFNISL